MKYYIIAGEASGDLHGSNLMKGLYAEDDRADIRFWGGDLMNSVYLACKKDGMTGGGLVRHYKEGAIMGFWEVFRKARQLLGNVRFCENDILSWKPDVVILIDYPGFNFKIAECAHKHGFKVFYYIAPKVWASREGRIKKLKKYVDKLFIVFPFEIPYFSKKGVEFIYKGNPLIDAIDDSPASNESRKDFLERNRLQDKPVIAMLAGSRKGEISTMMPVLREFAEKMTALPQYSGYQFIVAGAPARNMEDYSPYLNDCKADIKVLFGQTQSIVRHAEAAVVNSGTASLETVLLGTPQVVGFIMGSRITYAIAKKIVKVKYISLGNLIIDRLAFKEFIQADCNADNLVNEVRALIEDQAYRQKMLSEYACIRKALGGRGASAAVAKAMIQELNLPVCD
ncbi:MAG: lipid-A-disaccharide synthase [Bacteroidetes bacterium]|uniref:Lipid-A-disaccharide synthase n=1 Tax=Candidatus Cryptobacteroides avicola TaxID=2840757 RepID=A0A940DRD4_9BACT|nr:lipid-A-disaccharide synthase [Candidatus Cryptobacteroides avicola]